MKNVLANHSEVAHKWANQSQPSGRSGNMFFDGPSIFSYGRHFEIARHVSGVVLFTTANYSVSTSKHKSYTRMAINHLTVFYVPTFEDHAGNVRHYLASIEVKHEEALRAVKYAQSSADGARGIAATMARYCETFKKEIPARLRQEAARVAKLARENKLFSAVELAKIAKAESARVESETKRREKSEAQRREWEAAEPERAMNRAHEEALQERREREAPAILEAWATGAGDELPSCRYTDQAPTRLRIKAGMIETSRGARVSVERALELWTLLQIGSGDLAPAVGFNIDGYRVNDWDGEALTIGCHVLRASELSRMAALLGVSH